MDAERLGHRQPLSLRKSIAASVKISERAPRYLRRQPDQRQGIFDHRPVISRHPIPFQHGKFGRVQPSALAVTEHPGKFENLLFARRQQFLGGEFRRGVKIKPAAAAVRQHGLGFKGMQVRLVARRCGQDAAFHFAEALMREMVPDTRLYPASKGQQRLAIGVVFRLPPGHLFLPCHPAKDPPNSAI